MSAQQKERYFARVPVNLIEVGRDQARTRKVDKEVDELAESIKRWGLIHPITVCREDNKYVLLAGQRRLLAVKQLGWELIDAEVVEKPEDPIKAKAFSLSESFVRTDLPDPDIIDACVAFFRRYHDIKIVSEELGLSRKKVRKYLKYDRLPNELKVLVNEKKVELGEALRAADTSELPDGSIDIEKAKTIALELKTLTGDQKKELDKIAEERPSATAEELIEEAKKPPRIKKYSITLAFREAEALERAAKDRERSPEETGGIAIIEWLARGGYL
jgi:ParB family chromosome partitioning protein